MTAPANLRGWGQGWPVNRQKDMRLVVAARSGARWYVHYDIAPIVQYVVDEVERRGYLFDHGPGDVDDDWGYANRPIRGRNVASNHSWGLAIDIDAQEYPMGTHRNPPAWIIDLFEQHGFEWGGRWSRPDPMHFEFEGWPSDARRIASTLNRQPAAPSQATTPVPAAVLAATEGDNVQVLVYTDTNKPTLITDGIHASILGPGEDQLMKDLGLVQSTTPKWVALPTYNRLVAAR